MIEEKILNKTKPKQQQKNAHKIKIKIASFFMLINILIFFYSKKSNKVMFIKQEIKFI